MSKVVRLMSKEDKATHEELMQQIKTIMEMADRGEITSILVAALGPEGIGGDVVTGWCGVDFNERQAILGHLQMDLVKSFIEYNYITP